VMLVRGWLVGLLGGTNNIILKNIIISISKYHIYSF